MPFIEAEDNNGKIPAPCETPDATSVIVEDTLFIEAD